jgi:acyl carrier protein
VLQIAPQLDVASVDDSDSLHDIGDIDSLDFLHLVALTAAATGIVVAPRDYARLATLDGFARYLMERQAEPVDP